MLLVFDISGHPAPRSGLVYEFRYLILRIQNSHHLTPGTILCGLMSYPDVLICNTNDWSQTSIPGTDGICKGVNCDEKDKKFSFSLGGQVFTGSKSIDFLILNSVCV